MNRAPRPIPAAGVLASLACVASALLAGIAAAQTAKPIDVNKARVIEYWTKERRANALPRDLVIDPRGLGYLRRPDGTLVPYGHDIAAQVAPGNQTILPFGKPSGGSGDTTPPVINPVSMKPKAGETIGASYTFEAEVTDNSGVVKSVTFKIQKDSSTFVNSISATKSADSNIWRVAVSGFTNGGWSWWVEAKDGASKGGNLGVSGKVSFTVNTGSSGGGGGGGDTVTNGDWSGGKVQTAAGRVYFEMPSNSRRTRWVGYVCSGTVAEDGTTGRSIIITAAHCVYDDANKAFARNVMFIPNQAATTGSGTDRNCDNDPLGCWVPSFGVVDADWTTRTFPNNIQWDYAYYVVSDSSAHRGTGSNTVLDTAAGALPVSFASVSVNDGSAGASSIDFTHALGYSYSEDPKFKYCAEDMTTEGAVNWWLPSCGLSGGSSGGPWVQKLVTDGNDPNFGGGPIVSVNSWGYTNSPGMAGPMLVAPASTASDVFVSAKGTCFPSVDPLAGDAGVKYPMAAGWACQP